MIETNINATIFLYDNSLGGRKSPIFEGYRSSVLFGINQSYDTIEFTGKLSKLDIQDLNLKLNSSATFIGFNETPVFNKDISTKMIFKNLNPILKKYLIKDSAFLIFEADNIIGKGVIREVSPDDRDL